MKRGRDLYSAARDFSPTNPFGGAGVVGEVTAGDHCARTRLFPVLALRKTLY